MSLEAELAGCQTLAEALRAVMRDQPQFVRLQMMTESIKAEIWLLFGHKVIWACIAGSPAVTGMEAVKQLARQQQIAQFGLEREVDPAAKFTPLSMPVEQLLDLIWQHKASTLSASQSNPMLSAGTLAPDGAGLARAALEPGSPRQNYAGVPKSVVTRDSEQRAAVKVGQAGGNSQSWTFELVLCAGTLAFTALMAIFIIQPALHKTVQFSEEDHMAASNYVLAAAESRVSFPVDSSAQHIVLITKRSTSSSPGSSRPVVAATAGGASKTAVATAPESPPSSGINADAAKDGHSLRTTHNTVNNYRYEFHEVAPGAWSWRRDGKVPTKTTSGK